MVGDMLVLPLYMPIAPHCHPARIISDGFDQNILSLLGLLQCDCSVLVETYYICKSAWCSTVKAFCYIGTLANMERAISAHVSL